MMAFSKSVNLTHAQTAVPCSVCEDEPPGEYYCIECKQTLCPQCEKNHRRVAATKNHNIVLRTQIGDIDTTILNCIDHRDNASLHCEKCNIPVCVKCITGKHRGHELSDLADIFDREKEVLQNNVTKMREILSKLKNEREEMTNEKKKYDTKMKQITKDLEAENEAAIKELHRIHNDKMKNLASIQGNHSTLFDNFNVEISKKIDLLEERITEHHETIRKNSLPAIINLSRRKESLPEFEIKPEIPKPPEFAPGDIQNFVKILGKLQFSSGSARGKLTGKPLEFTTSTVLRFKYPLQGIPSICITKEGDVWLGGHESRELVMVDIKGHVLRRRQIKYRPGAMTVMDCDDVILSPRSSDSRTVSRLLKDGREQHIYDTSPSYSLGVSVTADQNILICTGDGRVVKVNSDGTDAKEIYKGAGVESVMHVVENANGNIYISDCKESAVVMVSKSGKVLSTIKTSDEGKSLIWPLGYALDKIGNVFLADRESHCVYIIDRNQQMRELLGYSYGMKYPSKLAVDNDNNLWIT